MEKLLNFDIYAMIKPKNREDLIALANEALDELAHINAELDKILAVKCQERQVA